MGAGRLSQARLVPARNPNGNSELAPEQSNYRFSGKETTCRDFGAASAVIVNNTCAGCVDKSKGQFSSYSMGIGGPANNFVPAMSYWAQPHPHGGGANTYDIPEGVHGGQYPFELRHCAVLIEWVAWVAWVDLVDLAFHRPVRYRAWWWRVRVHDADAPLGQLGLRDQRRGCNGQQYHVRSRRVPGSARGERRPVYFPTNI